MSSRRIPPSVRSAWGSSPPPGCRPWLVAAGGRASHEPRRPRIDVDRRIGENPPNPRDQYPRRSGRHAPHLEAAKPERHNSQLGRSPLRIERGSSPAGPLARLTDLAAVPDNRSGWIYWAFREAVRSIKARAKYRDPFIRPAAQCAMSRRQWQSGKPDAPGSPTCAIPGPTTPTISLRRWQLAAIER